MEYQIKIEDRDIKIEKSSTEFRINGKSSPYTLEKNGDRYFIYTEGSVSTVLVGETKDDKITLNINGKDVEVSVKDHIALMLERLGIDNSEESTINEVKAPMPGVIMSIIVDEGQEIKKGDPLLILEAMKMENMIKSPTDGKVGPISIEKGQSVEKNETLISFD
ncbi:MAG: biotin/lipoyl-binding protein [Cytophagales bacterium]|nr:biotin/lipoyl-binding protein [Cytophagales bacterium]